MWNIKACPQSYEISTPAPPNRTLKGQAPSMLAHFAEPKHLAPLLADLLEQRALCPIRWVKFMSFTPLIILHSKGIIGHPVQESLLLAAS